jgi:predicted TIM-barrel fold metal-dependent hydrolase
MAERKFYDIHLHLLNISHAGLLAYLNRFLENHTISYKRLLKKPALKVFIPLLIDLIFSNKGKSRRNRYIWKSIIIFSVILALSSLLFIITTLLFGIHYFVDKPGLTDFNLISQIIAITSLIVLITLIIEIFLIFILMKNILGTFKEKPVYNTQTKLPKKEKGFNAMMKTLINQLSLLENDIGSSLQQMEIDILCLDENFSSIQLASNHNKTIKETFRNLPKYDNEKKKEIQTEIETAWTQHNKKRFSIGSLPGKYKKIVLTPLIIDFGYDRFNIKGIHYKNPPSKPVVVQTKEVFFGIQNYLSTSKFQLFEIYPFMGLNPEHYDLYEDTNIDGHNSLQLMFDKYFSCFKKQEDGRDQKLSDKKNEYSDNLDRTADEIILKKINRELFERKDKDKKKVKSELSTYQSVFNDLEKKEKISEKSSNDIRNEFYNYFFAGIKVYPPLGFDPAPWADEEKKISDLLNYFKNNGISGTKSSVQLLRQSIRLSDAEEKLIFIYANCVDKNIPITSHCNNGGFLSETKTNIAKYTNPLRWEKVLELFPDLKLNLAHLGGGNFKDGYEKALTPAEIEAKSWRSKVYELVTSYENVYTDFSCMCFDDFDYNVFRNELDDWIKKQGKSDIESKLFSKILFGTDFSINLMFGAKSYQEYVGNFTTQQSFTKLREQFCEINPYRFLFG